MKKMESGSIIEKEYINKRIKDLPISERPYERCEKYGAKSLTDAELLAVVMKTGTKSKRAVDLAHEILELKEQFKGLTTLSHVTFDELMKIKGIGKVKAIQILCVVELASRMAKTSQDKGVFFVKPSDIAQFYMQDMRNLEYEQVILVLLNSKNKVIKEIKLSKGTVNASLITPREVFIYALKYGAVNIALIHNHPSGNPEPSNSDIIVTKKVSDTGKLIGIELIDHIIIGDNIFTSMRESGYIK
jgi:DNA repair protein RadC